MTAVLLFFSLFLGLLFSLKIIQDASEIKTADIKRTLIHG